MNSRDIIQDKIFDANSLGRKLNLWRFKGQRIVFTNGCFDILHKGHIHLLTKASEFGDVLIVGLNSDVSVRNLKGINRPLQDETTRCHLLASLFYVNAVIKFDEDTPAELIKLVSPDVLVKGGDYTIDNIVGADWVIQHGGIVEVVSLLDGYSTSNIEDKMRRQ